MMGRELVIKEKPAPEARALSWDKCHRPLPAPGCGASSHGWKLRPENQEPQGTVRSPPEQWETSDCALGLAGCGDSPALCALRVCSA